MVSLEKYVKAARPTFCAFRGRNQTTMNHTSSCSFRKRDFETKPSNKSRNITKQFIQKLNQLLRSDAPRQRVHSTAFMSNLATYFLNQIFTDTVYKIKNATDKFKHNFNWKNPIDRTIHYENSMFKEHFSQGNTCTSQNCLNFSTREILPYSNFQLLFSDAKFQCLFHTNGQICANHLDGLR